MEVRDVFARKIFDSRGDPTIEVCLTERGGRSFFSQIPSGKSTGTNEVSVFSFEEAEESTHAMRKFLFKKNIFSIREMDEYVESNDRTEKKEKIGGNVSLGISIAAAKAIAFERGKELWEVINEEFFGGVSGRGKPIMFSNLINGGAHAKNNLDIQEYMTVIKTPEMYASSVAILERFYRDVGVYLKNALGIQTLSVGDEEGYSVDFSNNEEPISVLESLIAENGLGETFSVGVDVAASGFFKEGKYYFEGHKLSTDEFLDVLSGYFKRHDDLLSIEDPFSENDPEGFGKILARFPDRWIVGDDLTVTNPRFLEAYWRKGCVNSVIIKPNQIGSVSKACDAMLVAKKFGVRTIISHRSGETEDTFIIHLAKGGAADGVKLGAPLNERVLKFNELIRIFD